MSLAARVVALVAAACGSLASAGMPPAAASPAASPAARATIGTAATPYVAAPAAEQPGPRITLASVSPLVLRPGEALVVTGAVDLTANLTAAPVVAPTVIRLIRGRSTMSSRSDVDDWAATTGPATGTELARHTLDAAAPRAAVPFRLEVPADDVRLSRPFGVIPLAVELVSGGRSGAVLRTFVGWQRSADYTPLSVAWLVPVTLAADPALSSPDAAARTSAWTAQVGAGSRLERLLLATAEHPVGYAVDPAVLGPLGRTAAADAADPAAAPRDSLTRALVAASAEHPVFTLPESDADLAALTAPDVVADTAAVLAEAAATTRLADRGVTVRGALAWPVDGVLPEGREAALRAAYGSRLEAVVVSAGATDPTARFTPPARGVAPLGSPVVRIDDRLAALLGRLGTPGDGVLAGQELVAQTAALLGERPSIGRTFLVAAPRGFDAGTDPEVLGRFLAAAESVPWLRTVGVDAALRPGSGLDAAPPLPTGPPGPPAPLGSAVGTASGAGAGTGASAGSLTRAEVLRVLTQRTLLDTLSRLLAPGSTTISRWAGVPLDLTSTRWRSNPTARDEVVRGLEAATTAVSNGVSVTPQTTNFLADEGVMQLTVVNALDEPVRGVRVVLQPGNGRIVVVEPSPPVDIAARAKATVSVRLAAVAQGLVPVNAWLTTADGTRIGATEQLTVRAAPPGAWLYVALGTIVGLILVAGIVRALRRPRVVVDTRGLDPVDPTPEEPLVAPVERHTAP